MARLNNINRDELSSSDQEYYDSIVGSRGSVRGPYGVLLHSPDLASRIAHTGTYVRFELDLPESLKETVIITAARAIRNQYEFAAHARLARAAGVAESTITTIAQGKSIDSLPEDEKLLVTYAQQLIRDHKIQDDVFNAVSEKYGIKKTVDITALIGHYLLVGQILSAFEVDLAEGMTAEITD